MPNLVIVIPFNANAQCDLDINAVQMQQFFNTIANHLLGDNVGAQINNIDIVYQNQNYVCAGGDYVVVFAHGARNDTSLYDNQGNRITLQNATRRLITIGAQNATRMLFMCCFSALGNHIADVWRAQNPNQDIYGGNEVISNLYSSTRTQIRSVCFALHQLP